MRQMAEGRKQMAECIRGAVERVTRPLCSAALQVTPALSHEGRGSKGTQVPS